MSMMFQKQTKWVGCYFLNGNIKSRYNMRSE